MRRLGLILIMLTALSLVFSPSPARAAGGYYTPITITEKSGNTLSDYAVRIELNSSFQGWSLLSSDGSDIYFTDAQGSPLYYWVEYYNKTSEEATLWVKVPSIPANGEVVVYMHYGGVNKYPDHNSPDNVFLFYDDFNYNTLDEMLNNGWAISSSLNPNNYNVNFDNSSIDVYTTYTGSSGTGMVAFYTTNFTISQSEPFIIEARAYHVKVGKRSLLSFGWYWNENNGGTGYWLRAESTDDTTWDKIKIVKDNSGTWSSLVDDGLHSFYNKWFRVKVIVDGTSYVANVHTEDDTLNVTLQATDTAFTSGHLLIFFEWTGNNQERKVDWVRVHPYVDPEPAVSVGGVYSDSSVVSSPLSLVASGGSFYLHGVLNVSGGCTVYPEVLAWYNESSGSVVYSLYVNGSLAEASFRNATGFYTLDGAPVNVSLPVVGVAEPRVTASCSGGGDTISFRWMPSGTIVYVNDTRHVISGGSGGYLTPYGVPVYNVSLNGNATISVYIPLLYSYGYDSLASAASYNASWAPSGFTPVETQWGSYALEASVDNTPGSRLVFNVLGGGGSPVQDPSITGYNDSVAGMTELDNLPYGSIVILSLNGTTAYWTTPGPYDGNGLSNMTIYVPANTSLQVFMPGQPYACSPVEENTSTGAVVYNLYFIGGGSVSFDGNNTAYTLSGDTLSVSVSLPLGYMYTLYDNSTGVYYDSFYASIANTTSHETPLEKIPRFTCLRAVFSRDPQAFPIPAFNPPRLEDVPGNMTGFWETHTWGAFKPVTLAMMVGSVYMATRSLSAVAVAAIVAAALYPAGWLVTIIGGALGGLLYMVWKRSRGDY